MRCYSHCIILSTSIRNDNIRSTYEPLDVYHIYRVIHIEVHIGFGQVFINIIDVNNKKKGAHYGPLQDTTLD